MPSFEKIQSYKLPEKEKPKFKVSQKVIVARSDGRLEKGWEVDTIGDRTITVTNRRLKKSKNVSPEDLQKWAEIGFASDEPVMVKRSTGQMESGWKVSEFGQGYITVVKPEGKALLTKIISLEDLKKWNKK